MTKKKKKKKKLHHTASNYLGLSLPYSVTYFNEDSDVGVTSMMESVPYWSVKASMTLLLRCAKARSRTIPLIFFTKPLSPDFMFMMRTMPVDFWGAERQNIS